MDLRHVIAATLVAPALGIACGSDRLTGPEQGAAMVQGTVEPTPVPNPFPPVFTPDIEDVIPSGLYTMRIEFDKSCRIPPSLNPMTYEVTARKGFLVTTEARPRPLNGFVNNYSFMTWNLPLSFNDDFDSGTCDQPDHISEPALYSCGDGFIGRSSGGLAATITGAAWVGDISTRSCGAEARHRVTLTLRQ
jgi:hypothetical protein